MNDKNFKEIEQALDIETKLVPAEPVEIESKPVPNDPQKDYEYSRGQLYNLIEKGQQAIDGILEVADSSNHPRAYDLDHTHEPLP